MSYQGDHVRDLLWSHRERSEGRRRTRLRIRMPLWIYCIIVVICSFWADRNLDFWATHVSGSEANVPYVLSLAVTMALCPWPIIVLLLNLAAEITRYFV
jgi:hypothetical protein